MTAKVRACTLVLAGFVAGLGLIGQAAAQAYPTKPIRVINSWTPGGPGDALTRPILTKLGERLGQPVVVDNRPGGSGIIGAVAVARSAPDGYTLLTGNLGPIAIAPAAEPTLPYDAVKDFEPITQLVSSPLVMLVRPTLPVDSLQAFIDYAKKNSGKLNYGNLGSLSTPHLAGELLFKQGGFTMQAVPYKGAAPVMTDLAAGQIDMGFINIGGAMPFIQSGRLRAIAVTTTTRSAALPDVPALHEMYPGFEVNSWYGMLAPAGTPKDVIARLHKEFVAVLQTTEIQELLKRSGFIAEGTTPEQYGAKIKADIALWTPIVKALNARIK